jgi:hypothetical protein
MPTISESCPPKNDIMYGTYNVPIKYKIPVLHVLSVFTSLTCKIISMRQASIRIIGQTLVQLETAVINIIAYDESTEFDNEIYTHWKVFKVEMFKSLIIHPQS